jgi:hypothetical protein
MISYNDYHNWVNAVLRQKFLELPATVLHRNTDVVTDIKVYKAIINIIDRIVANTTMYNPRSEFRVDPNNNKRVVPYLNNTETGRMFNSLKKSFLSDFEVMMSAKVKQ